MKLEQTVKLFAGIVEVGAGQEGMFSITWNKGSKLGGVWHFSWSTHEIVKKNENRMFHTCDYCGKQGTTKAGLQGHMLRHYKENNCVHRMRETVWQKS